MEMNDIYVNHAVVKRSPGRRMKRTSPKPAGHGAAEFSDDEMPDYENISVMTDKKNHQPPSEMPPSKPGKSEQHGTGTHSPRSGCILMLGIGSQKCFILRT
ncbi:hypothetical protein G0U57_004394 [Chelydra serpentina]|uniref:Uncharacterized protein n=1 Tax=Chelydra serpentina TaxID=8475 RepID=A0A8T1RZG8_CHESE|nr:hypothetical protein G0U57_004394 [Chelydra serpentina]